MANNTGPTFKGLQNIRIAIKSWCLLTMTRLVASTWKVELHDPENVIARASRKELKVLFPVFHHTYLVCFHVTQHQGYVTLTADNEAGEVLSRMIHAMGFTTCRVSADDNARSDARAAIRMIDAMRDGASGAIAVDGPSGPAGKVKPGTFTIGVKSSAHIYPAATGSRRALVLEKRWDKFRIPLPFTKVTVLVGPEFIPVQPMTGESLQTDCERLEKILKDLNVKAEAEAKN